MKLSRRNVMGSSASFLAMALASPARATGSDKSTARLEIHSDQKLSAVPANFIGLSYESQELQDSGFFSPDNRGLIAKFRELAALGTLRLGGDTVDYAFWSSDPNAKPPVRQKRAYVEGDPHPDLTWRVTPEALHNLRGFLDATNWKCLYSLNFGTSLPEIAAAEARAAVEILGPRLLQLHIGNEADRFGSTIRDPLTWDANAYMEQWLPFARAVAQAVPDTKIGMPDISLRIEWFPTIVKALMNDPLRERLGCLAHHHYFSGPPSNPYVTIPNMLRRDDNVLRRANTVSSAARQLGTVWRMTEGNSCFLGGKPGVSDVFAASLWMADYLLLLALLGYAGVNIHGGSGEMVASSLGGLLPGERLMADPKEPHNRPFYTPIAGGPAHFRDGPTYYGMQFASAFAGLRMVHVEFDPGNVNATAYAARAKDGRIRVAIINKDEHETLKLARTDFEVLSVLRAPSLTSKDISLERDESHRRISSVPPASAVMLQTA